MTTITDEQAEAEAKARAAIEMRIAGMKLISRRLWHQLYAEVDYLPRMLLPKGNEDDQ